MRKKLTDRQGVVKINGIELVQGFGYDVLPREDGKYHSYITAQIGRRFYVNEIGAFNTQKEAETIATLLQESWLRVAHAESFIKM